MSEERKKLFLNKLAVLLEEFNAGISYNTDDDGVHLTIDGGEVIFIGQLDSDIVDPGLELRRATG